MRAAHFDVAAQAGNPLARRIAQRIEDAGRLTFAEFMEAALYDVDFGYYRSGRTTVGREGDFLTSPEVHPLFGHAIGYVASALWRAMDRPRDFVVRDVGAGTGALMAGVLAWASAQDAEFNEALRGELVEPSKAAAERQQRTLSPDGERLTWMRDLHDAPPVQGLVVGNELLDAQPVHRLRWDGSAWREIFVGLSDDGGFRDVDGEPSEATLTEPLAQISPKKGQIVEVCAGIGDVVAGLAESVERGVVLSFDYGYARERLYAPWRTDGTLMTFHRHTPGDDPYARVGEQDITCHVDVDAVRAAAESAGMRGYAVRSQAEFLAAIGAAEAAGIDGAGRGAAMDDYLARRRAIEVLSDPAGLGRIQVMAYAVDLNAELPGLGVPC